jgi:hypothetical protein
MAQDQFILTGPVPVLVSLGVSELAFQTGTLSRFSSPILDLPDPLDVDPIKE